jgi:hypothetical protein
MPHLTVLSFPNTCNREEFASKYENLKIKVMILLTTDRWNFRKARMILCNSWTTKTVARYDSQPEQWAAQGTEGTHNGCISRDTVTRRLCLNNLRCRRPARRPVLQPRHWQARLQRAQGHQNWRQREWRYVIFSDESRFCVSHADRRVRIWRRQGQRFADRNILERDAWGGPSGTGNDARIGPMCSQNVGKVEAT